MAFTKLNLQINRGTTTANAQGNGISVAMHTYLTSVDTIAAVTSLDYFPPNFVSPDTASPNISVQPVADEIFINDFLLVKATDNVGLFLIEAVNPVQLGGNLLIGAGGISIGAPIAAIDNNALAIQFGALVAEYADETHNGILSTAPQTIAGAKTFTDNMVINGINIGQFGGNPAIFLGSSSSNIYWTNNGSMTFINFAPNTYLGQGTGSLTYVVGSNTIFAFGTASTQLGLSGSQVSIDSSSSLTFNNGGGTITTYAYNTSTVTWNGPWAAPKTGTLSLSLENNMVKIAVANVSESAAITSTVITLASVIPVAFRPSVNRLAPVTVTNNSVLVSATALIQPSGTITIGADLAGDNFAATGNAGFYDWSLSYNL